MLSPEDHADKIEGSWTADSWRNVTRQHFEAIICDITAELILQGGDKTIIRVLGKEYCKELRERGSKLVRERSLLSRVAEDKETWVKIVHEYIFAASPRSKQLASEYKKRIFRI